MSKVGGKESGLQAYSGCVGCQVWEREVMETHPAIVIAAGRPPRICMSRKIEHGGRQ